MDRCERGYLWINALKHAFIRMPMKIWGQFAKVAGFDTRLTNGLSMAKTFGCGSQVAACELVYGSSISLSRSMQNLDLQRRRPRYRSRRLQSMTWGRCGTLHLVASQTTTMLSSSAFAASRETFKDFSGELTTAWTSIAPSPLLETPRDCLLKFLLLPQASYCWMPPT